MTAEEQLIELFENGTFAHKSEGEICAALSLNKKESAHLKDILMNLCAKGKLCRDGKKGFATPEQAGAIKGTISASERGFAFLVPEDREKYKNDFFIPPRYLHGALNKDEVLALPVRGGEDDNVQVITILTRGVTVVVGTFFMGGKHGYVRPDDKKFNKDVFIPLSECKSTESGQKVLAEITGYSPEGEPRGKIKEVLYAENGFLLRELSLIRSHSLYESFPAEVEENAKSVASHGVDKNEISKRRDFRDKLIITVDGEDTRDIDDAISVEKKGRSYILGVHIADVSEYVTRKSPLDEEAFKRGTSVYFPDRVLPMLPKELSNGICSLNEGEDRLTLSCMMKIDSRGKITDSKIEKSVIRSSHRMTYHEIDAIYNGDEEAVKKYPDLIEFVKTAIELTKILTDARKKKGCVELEVTESHIIVNKEGKIEIPDVERLISQDMIEQFMVLANETTASFMYNLSAPYVYRVHEKPSEEKAEGFKEFLRGLGVKADFVSSDVKPADFQKILLSVQDEAVYKVVNQVMLRSMMKAKYSPINIGHFGLASKCYCHFTSPIRRYPDLCVHRIIKSVLDGEYTSLNEKYSSFVSEAADQSSKAEKNALEAEREVDDLYCVEYMHDKMGEEYDAVISGVTSGAIFAELKNAVEGVIGIEFLPKDDYEYIPEKYALTGRTHSFKIGDEIRIKVAGCNYDSRKVEFSLADKKQ